MNATVRAFCFRTIRAGVERTCSTPLMFKRTCCFEQFTIRKMQHVGVTETNFLYRWTNVLAHLAGQGRGEFFAWFGVSSNLILTPIKNTRRKNNCDGETSLSWSTSVYKKVAGTDITPGKSLINECAAYEVWSWVVRPLLNGFDQGGIRTPSVCRSVRGRQYR